MIAPQAAAAIALATGITMLALSPSAASEDQAMLTPPPPAMGNQQAVTVRGPLDGMSFVGTLGPDGKPGDRDDVIHFADGQFWSENCVPCGFPPGPYWVRYQDDAIHFRGELNSPESGEFVYSGVVQDDRLTVTMNWRRDRWYWSIERDFWFEGSLKASPVSGSVPNPSSIAVAAANDPRACEP